MIITVKLEGYKNGEWKTRKKVTDSLDHEADLIKSVLKSYAQLRAIHQDDLYCLKNELYDDIQLRRSEVFDL